MKDTEANRVARQLRSIDVGLFTVVHNASAASDIALMFSKEAIPRIEEVHIMCSSAVGKSTFFPSLDVAKCHFEFDVDKFDKNINAEYTHDTYRRACNIAMYSRMSINEVKREIKKLLSEEVMREDSASEISGTIFGLTCREDINDGTFLKDTAPHFRDLEYGKKKKKRF